MIADIIALKSANLFLFAIIIYFASFAIPTGALFFILSFSSITTTINERIILFVIILISAILGDISTYYFARLFSKKANKLFSVNAWLKKKEIKAHKFIEKYGIYAIFFSRFLFSGIGSIINYYCGIRKYSAKKFIISIVLGELVYVIIYSTLGIIFKEYISEILNLINGIAILSILGIAIYFVSKSLIKELKK